ncbi:maleylpyruvate isomerase family mycothiol-dependent enzyme [Streptomyces sp. NPDC048340]|uniref:maleylpyruvate isomerase family mycothiol-dependent enzyme n=1 Tax=Streptomyces sp. NPDC048340 TaxID=3365537 RepID=UPI0037135DA4
MTGMDHIARLARFRTETAAFEKAVQRAVDQAAGGPAPLVPPCPGWTVSDLVAHLGGVHRYLSHILRGRLTEAPDATDPALYGLPADPAERAAWPMPDRAPNHGPVPQTLTDWFAEGARDLAGLLGELGPDTPVWTWSAEQTSGFWMRMQLIELAVHRWDAESVTGGPQPLDPALASDAVPQTFEVMAPARRAWTSAPPGSGERHRFRRTDGPGSWTVEFTPDAVLLDPDPASPVPVELSGTASDLLLFLWHRIPPAALTVRGDASLLPRWFTLVPPV